MHNMLAKHLTWADGDPSDRAYNIGPQSLSPLCLPGLHLYNQIMCADSQTLYGDAGTAHIVAILLVLSRLTSILGGCRFRKYRLQSVPRIMQGTAIAAVALCLLVELFQLNARIAADPTPLLDGDMAPFEWAGGQPSALSSIVVTVHFIRIHGALQGHPGLCLRCACVEHS